MIEIRYGEHYEVADLAGQSVAEVREQYKQEFGIPDKAQAKLNSKVLKKKLESETKLNANDELSFAEKSRRGLVLVGALALTLAITGGVFAFTWTTASVTVSATGASDYAAVEPASPLPSFTTVFGKLRGDIPTGGVFNITPGTGYTGDLLVKVYLTNADEMSKVYQHFNMKLELRVGDSNVYSGVTGHTFQLLTLDNGVVTFDMNGYEEDSTWKVYLAGGSYVTNPKSPRAWGGGSEVSPLLYCEVTQR